METAEEQETLRREAREHQVEDDTEIETESNPDSLCDPVDDEEVGVIRQIVNVRSLAVDLCRAALLRKVSGL